ncbi:MAG: efflux RND transporter periplasmic adaptor subunit [Spirosomataceae bacterium]
MKKYLFLGLLALMACQTQQTDSTEAEASTTEITLTAEQEKSFAIQVGGVETQTVNETIKVNGTVEAPPQNLASVSFPISGFIKNVQVLVGSYVKQGQALATIQSMELVQLQQDYLQTLSQLKLQEQELARQRTLNNEDVGTKRRLQEAEAAFSSSKALLNALEIKLKMLGLAPETLQKGTMVSEISLKAPISGSVHGIAVNVGKTFAPTDVLFEIISPDHVHLMLKVYEKDANKVKIGLPFTVEAAGQQLSGNIYLVGKMFENSERAIQVFGKLSHPADERQLTPGQYVTAQLQTQTRMAQVLPDAAVVREGELSSVFIEEKAHTFRKVPVRLGVETNGMVEVLSETDLTHAKIVRVGAKLLSAELSKGIDMEE